MGSINPPDHIHAYSHTKGLGGNAAHDRSEVEQMQYILTLMLAMNSALPQDCSRDILHVQDEFTQDLKQPITQGTLIEMEAQLNKLLNSLQEQGFGWFQWSIEDDQQKPGFSFMHAMLNFSQFIEGHWGTNNPTLQKELAQKVADFGNYLNTGAWDSEDLSKFINDYLSLVNQMGKNTNGNTLPYIYPVPSNFFS